MELKPKFQVALLIETSKSYGCGLLRGVSKYVRAHRGWSIVVNERSLNEPPPPWLKRAEFDGILLRTNRPEVAKAAKNAARAVINLGELNLTDLPFVHTNDQAASEMAANHLIERGFRSFAYAGLSGNSWSVLRRDEFVRVLKEAGFGCEVFEFDAPGPGGLTETQASARMQKWIRSLNKPTGLMACYDVMGLRVLEACRALSIAVPQEVAVVGVDNDQLLCELASPPLSSVSHSLEQIGYRASEMLTAMMSGESIASKREMIPPSRIVVRQSSDLIAVDDPVVAQALSLMQKNAADGINVEQILQLLPVSQASLSRRFRKALGRSPKAEILRLRLERVKQLLAETDLKLSAISTMAGFTHPEHMAAIFKQKTGQCPSEYRRSTHPSL
jgi:LacI family transcriptional regulator